MSNGTINRGPRFEGDPKEKTSPKEIISLFLLVLGIPMTIGGVGMILGWGGILLLAGVVLTALGVVLGLSKTGKD